jgi:hypothetical protein
MSRRPTRRPAQGTRTTWTPPTGRPLPRGGERLTMTGLDAAGQTIEIEFQIRLATVEIWISQQCGAVFDRPLMRDWLSRPWRPLVAGEVRLLLDMTASSTGRISLNLPGVGTVPMAPHLVRRLRRLV